MTLQQHSFTVDRFDPLALFLYLAPDGPGFLESPELTSRTGRYSIIALRHRESYRLDDDGLSLLRDGIETFLPGDPLQTLAGILEQRRLPKETSVPFCGGFFGYFGYDLAAWLEELPRLARRDRPLPALWLDWVDLCAVYDHQNGTVTLSSLVPGDDLQALEEKIRVALEHPLPASGQVSCEAPAAILQQAEFEKMVRQAKDYIAAGDIYQANLSVRFDGHCSLPSAQLYARLRRINPSPFGCLLRTPHLDIVSCSPERLVSLHGTTAELRPIAGTRPRGYSPPEDARLGEELLGHPKERAEHIMLLDLERNDLGKVCRPGSIVVDELMVLERYSHVCHIVSNLRGELCEGAGPFDLIRATFPGGTITGVPKKRCMEIIEELEPVGRGTYTGSAGYISACGTMDLNILIRTFQKFGDQLTYQTGAGIVADSVPEREWHECLSKGAALRQALEEPC
ncbi:aminodeoxychorismate synthase component I [Syntrophotalea acetylenivorans]|uniref:Aminodeoxychorismate synthase component I n=1 Tax=Syntrophotalea acetylenivorans TaxID=1842532 RepID=A0A1L3GNM4_9BACT|nr:anthranilate synthase component I family protein [Syntrophotalea acetylenivorans]APG27511.1 aminodeoxychorismate synthase component I [Syntrophotalea acetylenivorans]